MRGHPQFDTTIDRRSLALFASRTYVPAPLSIYRGIFKLEPGCILRLGEGARSPSADEIPSEGYDAGGVSMLIGVLAGRLAGGAALLISSHDAEFLDQLGARRLVLAGGRELPPSSDDASD